MSKSYVTLYISTRPISKKKSLTLLNEKALNAAFKVPTRETQKLMRQKEVKPIISHPKNSIIIFPDDTRISILIIKEHKKRRNLSTKGSYLK
jgi:hypothetical protein